MRTCGADPAPDFRGGERSRSQHVARLSGTRLALGGATRRCCRTCRLITSGPLAAESGRLAQSGPDAKILRPNLRESVDVILVDCPPILAVSGSADHLRARRWHGARLPRWQNPAGCARRAAQFCIGGRRGSSAWCSISRATIGRRLLLPGLQMSYPGPTGFRRRSAKRRRRTIRPAISA